MVKQILTDPKGEIKSSIVIVGDFNVVLISWIDHRDRKSVRKHWL